MSNIQDKVGVGVKTPSPEIHKESQEAKNPKKKKLRKNEIEGQLEMERDFNIPISSIKIYEEDNSN